ncbi:MAG: hypothetical protein SF002_18075 [Alphaproteobacteria bacterium]|nr:hypothetical protein [Alphaproteobacteria bacterium]
MAAGGQSGQPPPADPTVARFQVAAAVRPSLVSRAVAAILAVALPLVAASSLLEVGLSRRVGEWSRQGVGLSPWAAVVWSAAWFRRVVVVARWAVVAAHQVAAAALSVVVPGQRRGWVAQSNSAPSKRSAIPARVGTD